MAEDKGYSPRSVCVIGETPVLVRSYDLVLTNKGEADTLTVILDMEYVDGGVFLQSEKRYEIEIWTGYIDESISADKIALEKLLVGKKYEEKLFQRFFGVIDQPEWSIGFDNGLTLTARDITGLLMDNKFSEKRQGGTTSATQVIKSIASKLTGIELKIDANNIYMGTKDGKSSSRVYNTANKSYWQVILDVARTTGYNLKKGPKSIELVKEEADPLVWTLIKTATKDEHKPWTNFQEIKVRYGVSGRQQKENVYVEVRAPGKRTKNSRGTPVIGKYPKNASGFSGEENTQYILKRVAKPLTQQEANVQAEYYAMQYLKGYMTGEVTMPFANPQWKPDDCITVVVDPSYKLYKDLKPMFTTQQGQKIFRIDSISEHFDVGGYTQRVEFETHPKYEIKKFGELKKTAPGTFE